MSSGPFIEVFVGESPMGSEVRLEENTATISVIVRAPEWMDVDVVKIWLNGEVHSVHELSFTDYEARVEVDVELLGDSWVVAEALGDGSLFPLQAPVDQTPVLLGDALAAFAGPLGFGNSGLGDLQDQYDRFCDRDYQSDWLNVDEPEFVPPGSLNRL